MNKEVSDWMRGENLETDGPEMPFIAIRGYDSVVWSRLYSREPNPVQYEPCKASESHCSHKTSTRLLSTIRWSQNFFALCRYLP